MAEQEPYFRVMLISASSVSIDKSRRLSTERVFNNELHGHEIEWEEKFLRLKTTETWGWNGAHKEREHTYWIPFTSILYVEWIGQETRPVCGHEEKVKGEGA